MEEAMHLRLLLVDLPFTEETRAETTTTMVTQALVRMDLVEATSEDLLLACVTTNEDLHRLTTSTNEDIFLLLRKTAATMDMVMVPTVEWAVDLHDRLLPVFVDRLPTGNGRVEASQDVLRPRKVLMVAALLVDLLLLPTPPRRVGDLKAKTRWSLAPPLLRPHHRLLARKARQAARVPARPGLPRAALRPRMARVSQRQLEPGRERRLHFVPTRQPGATERSVMSPPLARMAAMSP